MFFDTVRKFVSYGSESWQRYFVKTTIPLTNMMIIMTNPALWVTKLLNQAKIPKTQLKSGLSFLTNVSSFTSAIRSQRIFTVVFIRHLCHVIKHNAKIIYSINMKIASKFFALLITGLLFASCRQEDIVPTESHFNHYPTELENAAPGTIERKVPQNSPKVKPHEK